MIRAVVFNDEITKIDGRSFYSATDKLEYFCDTNGIGKENIVSVSLSGGDRYEIRNKILLVYDK